MPGPRPHRQTAPLLPCVGFAEGMEEGLDLPSNSLRGWPMSGKAMPPEGLLGGSLSAQPRGAALHTDCIPHMLQGRPLSRPGVPWICPHLVANITHRLRFQPGPQVLLMPRYLPREHIPFPCGSCTDPAQPASPPAAWQGWHRPCTFDQPLPPQLLRLMPSWIPTSRPLSPLG